MAYKAANLPMSAVFAPPVCTFRNAFWARAVDCLEGPVLAVDADARPIWTLAALCAVLGRPTLIVATGGLWIDPETGEVQERLHCFWRLTRPARTAEEHQELRVARKLACDLTASDASAVSTVHPLRIAGSWHRKAEPRLACVVEENDDVELDLGDTLRKLRALPDDAFARRPDKGARAAPNPNKTADSEDVAAALRVIPNSDWAWDEWVKIGMAVWLATEGDWHGGFLAFDAWSEQSWKYDAEKTAAQWDHFFSSPPEHIGAGTLFWLAAKHSPGWIKPSARFDAGKWHEPVEEPQEKGKERPGGGSEGPDSWPEPKPLPSGLLPVAAFDPEMIPAALGPWVMDISDRMQCPPDFVAAAAVVALSSVLGRKVAVRPQLMTDWTEVSNLWGCIVGRPGAMKSPAMAEAMKPLNRLEAEARERNAEALARHERATEAYEIRKDAARKGARAKAKDGLGIGDMLDIDKPEKPAAKRFLCNDATYEALGEILAANPNGVLAFRDELVSLLKTLDREENAAARGFFLTAWNGTSGYTFDRIMRGLTHIDAACVSMLGSTQPGRLADYLGRAVKGAAGDDGLIQRFSVLVWPDEGGSWKEVDRWPDSQARKDAWDAFMRLHELTPARVGAEQSDFDKLPFLRLGATARNLFGGWRADLEARLRSSTMHASLESHLAKYRKMVPGLALLNHLADGGEGAVAEAAMRRALGFSAYLESHARRAYGSGHQVEVETAKAILARIRKGDLKSEFTARDITEQDWSNLRDKDQVKAGLELLEDRNWIRSREVKTGGRPKVLFTVNPRAAA